MKLYNTLNRKISNFKPISNEVVTIYTCGPTVYDHAHVGHWFTYIRNDLLIRTLKLAGYEPRWVINITDVGHLTSDADEGEDKLELGAKREGKTAWQIARYYEEEFLREMNQLNITTPNYILRATEHINEQIELIKILQSKGYTYKIDDGLYFDTSKFKNYANLAKLDLEEQQAGARVEFNTNKKNKSDFALWKFSPKGQKRDMEWESPWGIGFPGWHIECSAMAMKVLGQTIDVHSGGIDHIPIHHTNEIAQSEAATGVTFVNYWFHTNHVLFNNKKISKSLGNSITIEEVFNKGFSAEDFRMLVLESSYMTQSMFSFQTLIAAQNRLTDLRAFALMRYQTRMKSKSLAKKIEHAKTKIKESMEDNLNTPMAIYYLSELVKEVLSSGLNNEDIEAFISFIKYIDDALGLELGKLKDISDQDKEIINLRNQARIDEDYSLSDEYRNILAEKGIKIRDDQETSYWFLER